MNKYNRKQIAAMIEKLEELQTDLIIVRDNEEITLNNIPDNFVNRKQQSYEAYYQLENALRDLDATIFSLIDAACAG